jgi:hypothetical protein
MRCGDSECDQRSDSELMLFRMLCEAEAAAHMAVDGVERTLGERGPAWWDDSSRRISTGIWRRTHHMPIGTRALLASTTEDSELPTAAIFDLDGTLLNSVDLHAIAWQEAMLEFGHDVSFEQARSQIGKGGDKLIPVFLSADEQRDHGRELEEWRSNRFKTQYLPLVRPFSAVPDLAATRARCWASDRRCVLGQEG